MSTSTNKPLTKTEVVSAMADATGLTKQQVNTFFDEMLNLISSNLKDGGPGVFSIPGLFKVKVSRKPAEPERTGIDPFTKQERVFKAKPARSVVKVSALKKLKDSV
jgi:nucleoid DNA-binding protein